MRQGANNWSLAGDSKVREVTREKPWTIGDMRQGANNWSLAGDSKVRELMTGKNRGQSET